MGEFSAISAIVQLKALVSDAEWADKENVLQACVENLDSDAYINEELKEEIKFI